MPYVRVNEIQKLAIEDMAAGLADEQESKADICPICDGGNSQDKSFSVRRKGNKLLFICHRDSCKAKGIIESGVGFTSNYIKDRPANVWANDIEEPPAWLRAELMRTYHLSHTEREKFHLRYSYENSRLLIPVYDRHKRHRGWVARAVSSSIKPKSLNYISEGEQLSWFTTGRMSTDALLIVEDPISAIRGSTYVDSVALLGTHLSLEKLKEFTQTEYKFIWLALDKDALSTATEIINDNRLFLPNIRLLPLEKDIKNLSRIEFESLLMRNKVV